MLQRFLADVDTRKRYWARSLVGWQRMHAAALGHQSPERCE